MPDRIKNIQHIKSLEKHAIKYEEEGNFPKALELFEKILKLYEHFGNENNIAYTCGNLGNIYCKLGDYHKAGELYQKCLDLSEQLGDNSSIAKSLHQIAVLKQEEGDYAQARILYEKSLKIEKELGDKNGVAESLAQIGKLAEIQGDLANAIGYYTVALAIFNQVKSLYAISVTKWLKNLTEKKSITESEFIINSLLKEYKYFLET